MRRSVGRTAPQAVMRELLHRVTGGAARLDAAAHDLCEYGCSPPAVSCYQFHGVPSPVQQAAEVTESPTGLCAVPCAAQLGMPRHRCLAGELKFRHSWYLHVMMMIQSVATALKNSRLHKNTGTKCRVTLNKRHEIAWHPRCRSATPLPARIPPGRPAPILSALNGPPAGQTSGHPQLMCGVPGSLGRSRRVRSCCAVAPAPAPPSGLQPRCAAWWAAAWSLRWQSPAAGGGRGGSSPLVLSWLIGWVVAACRGPTMRAKLKCWTREKARQFKCWPGILLGSWRRRHSITPASILSRSAQKD
jgi:hypothetical protein